MRRWNGWGEETTQMEMPAHGAAFLRERLGDRHTLPDASLDSALAAVPASRLAPTRFTASSPGTA